MTGDRRHWTVRRRRLSGRLGHDCNQTAWVGPGRNRFIPLCPVSSIQCVPCQSVSCLPALSSCSANRPWQGFNWSLLAADTQSLPGRSDRPGAPHQTVVCWPRPNHSAPTIPPWTRESRTPHHAPAFQLTAVREASEVPSGGGTDHPTKIGVIWFVCTK